MDLGTFSKADDGYRVRLERVYQHNINTVWDAITNPDKLKIWFTDFEIDFRVDGEMTIWFRDEARTPSYGKVVRIEPPHIFEWFWEDELATFELSEVNSNSCRLTLTYTRIDKSYAAKVPAGFHLLLDQLETVLDGRSEPYPFEGKETPELAKLQAAYTAKLFPAYPELFN